MMNAKELEARTIETYDNNAAQWATSHMDGSEWGPTMQAFNALLPSGKILEIGCGGGRDASKLLGLGYDYLGTDASAGMVQAARANTPSAQFEQRSVYDLAGLHAKFDGFWACAVLLHIPKNQIDEALQSIKACLKSDAIGMISIKDGDKEDFEIRDQAGAHEERLFAYWRKDEFLDVLTRNGFALCDYTYRPVSKRTNWHIFLVKNQKEAR
jgi:SAM-dependent methyltransferase